LNFHKKYNIKRFYFFDDLSTVNKNRIIEFCELKANSVLKNMTWKLSARVNNIDDDIAAALKKAKCDDIAFGIE